MSEIINSTQQRK